MITNARRVFSTTLPTPSLPHCHNHMRLNLAAHNPFHHEIRSPLKQTGIPGLDFFAYPLRRPFS